MEFYSGKIKPEQHLLMTKISQQLKPNSSRKSLTPVLNSQTIDFGPLIMLPDLGGGKGGKKAPIFAQACPKHLFVLGKSPHRRSEC